MVVVKTGQFLEGSPMWYSVGPIVKSMSAVMQGQLEQNRKLEGDAISNHSDGNGS